MPSDKENPPPAAKLIAAWLATWFYVGHLTKSPGTVASIVALPLAWGIVWLGSAWLLFSAAMLVFFFGRWAVQIHMDEGGVHDPGSIVVDEIVGQWITLLAAPLSPLAYIVGLIAFRVFDILKPWPIGWLDQNVKDAFGVMIDDVVAAIYAGMVLYGVVWLMGL